MQSGPVRVLLVEDEATDAEFADRALSKTFPEQFKLCWVERLSDAVTQLDSSRFDVVLLDLGLPECDGLETLLELRGRNHEIPIVVLTGLHDEQVALEALEQGAQDYLVKGGLTADSLVRSIRFAVQRQQLLAATIERRLATDARAKLAAVVEFSDDAIFSETLDGIVDSWNAGAQRLFGCSAGEILGRTVAPFVPPCRMHELQQMLAAVQRGERLQNFETERTRKDGQPIWVSLSVSPIKDSDDKIAGVSKIARDITATRSLQAERDRLLKQLSLQIARLPLAYILMDQQGCVLEWNPAAERMFGYARQEAVGRSCFELIVPTPMDSRVHELIDRIWAGDMNAHSVNENRTKDGRTLTCEWMNTPLLDDDGRVFAVISLAQDVTERKRTEAALEERMRHALLAAQVGVILTGQEDLRRTLQDCCAAVVEHLDVAFAGIWTLKAEENVLELQASAGPYAGQDGPHGQAPVSTLKIGQIAQQRRPHLSNQVIGDPCLGDQEWATREGMVAFAGYPLICHDRLVGVIAMFSRRKITDTALKAIESVSDGIAMGIERCRVTAELKTSEERFDLAVRGSSDGLWDWNILTGAGYLSPRFKEMLGYKEDELENSFNTFESLLHPDDRARVLEDVYQRIRERAPYSGEFRMRSKRGEIRWFCSRGRAIWNADGQPYRMSGAVTDITERKQMETALALRDEQLRQSQKLEAVGSLAGGIAHEFNNLLQAIRGFANFALEGLPPEGQRAKDLQQVVTATNRAATLTRQLLGFSRRQVLERVAMDPREVVLDLVKMLRPLIGEQIELVVSPATDVCQVSADQGLLQQMLINLCINARDAMPSGGRLVLKTKRVDFTPQYCEFHPTTKPGPYLLFSVSDNGCGIPPDVKDRIFEPFFTTKEVGKGTGLGLATVYGIVQQHNGMINVYSEVGIGTTFNIYLPLDAGAKTSSAEPARDPSRGGMETILFAEDEPMVRDLAVRILQQAGYTLLVATDGAQAVELFEANAGVISLALLDAVMPRLNGRQVYDRIKLRKPDLPVVFCSGYDAETGQLQFLLNQGLRLVQKPFDPEVLLRNVRDALDAPNLLECTA